MGNISLPDITFDILPAQQAQLNQPTKVLFVGQMTSAGSATSGALQSMIQNGGQESQLFGQNSSLAGMIRNAKLINQATQFDAIGISDNSGGTSATGSIVFTGPASANGTINIAIGSAYWHTYALPVTAAETATSLATALAALINADANTMVTASASTGTVTLTCDHKGTIGNTIGIWVQNAVAGVTSTITGFSGGATDPSLTALWAAVTGLRYQTVVWPSNWGFSSVVTQLNANFNATNAILDGVAISAETNTLSNLITAGNALNSQCLTIIGNKTVSNSSYVGGAIFELDVNLGGQFAGLRSLRLTTGANLSQYVISTFGQRDTYGGVALSSLPYFNTPFPYLTVSLPGNGWLYAEWQELMAAGVSVLGNNIVNNSIISGEMVTTYKTDAAGNQDLSYKFLNYVDTIVAAREYFWNNFRAQYAQSRLTNGDLVPNRSMANPQSITAFAAGLYLALTGEDYCLLQAGEAARKFFLANLVVTLNLETGLVNLACQVPIVTQFRQMLASMQISFSAQG